MEEELWKTIPISLKFEASTHGRIRNKKTGRVHKSSKTPLGYRAVSIKGTHGEEITRLVHRLVAITFLPNPENKPTVNHLKHGRSDNNVSNLEWATRQRQADHSRKRKLTSDEIGFEEAWGARHIWKCDKQTGEKLEMFETVRDAANSVQAARCMAKINTVAEGHEISTSMADYRQCITSAAGFKWEFDELRVLATEEWRDIDPVDVKGAKGYQISTLGRLYTPAGEVKSPSGPSYSKHYICDEAFSAHRLVALTFIPRVEGKNEVNHLDGNKCNPNIDNLAWVTRSENLQHAFATGLKTAKPTKLMQYDLEGRFIKSFDSWTEARLELGSVSIHRSINTGTPAGGFLWKHESEDKDRVVKRKPVVRNKKVQQYDMNKDFIRDYPSMKAAQREVPGLSEKAARERTPSAGYLWKYASDPTPVTRRTNLKKKKIDQLGLDMNFIRQHESITAARVVVPGADVTRAIRDSRPSKGFFWKYA